MRSKFRKKLIISLHATDGDDDLSSFSRLPDEIVLEILKKLMELKTLCICKLVSQRFYLIIHQVDVVSFNVPLFDFRCDDDGDSYFSAVFYFFRSGLFQSAIESMNMFRCLKSLSINLPFPSQKCVGLDGNRYQFMTKVKLGNNRIDSYLFLSPNSISCNTDSSEVGQEDDYVFDLKKLQLAFICLMMDVVNRSKLLFRLITTFPLLEEVSITDLAKRVTISLSGSKMVEMRKWPLSFPETEQEWYLGSHPRSYCYIPLLELPVSGYVMKGVTLLLVKNKCLPDGHDSFLNIVEEDSLEDIEEVVYNEAVTEIFKKHKGRIKWN